MQYAVLTKCTNLDLLAFTPTIIIGFYTAGNEKLFSANTEHFKQAFPHVDILGCSSESNINDILPHVDHFQCTYLCLNIKKEAYAVSIIKAGEDTDLYPFPDNDPAAIIFSTDYSELLDNTLETLNQTEKSPTYIGAIAGSSLDSDHTPSLFCNGTYYKNDAILLWHINQEFYTLSGISLHDFTPVGSVFEVTKTEEDKIVEVDYKPALDAIEEMTGPLAQTNIDAFDYPLFIAPKKESGAFHTPLSSIKAIDRERKTIEIFKKTKARAKFRVGIPLSRAVQEMQLKKFSRFRAENAVALLFVCIAYKYHWRNFEPLYLMRIAHALKLPFIGLHTFGEIGPLSLDDVTQIQNQTVTLAVLSERKEVKCVF